MAYQQYWRSKGPCLGWATFGWTSYIDNIGIPSPVQAIIGHPCGTHLIDLVTSCLAAPHLTHIAFSKLMTSISSTGPEPRLVPNLPLP